MRKILYSPGWGAGWSTWHNVPKEFACCYEPIIVALELGETLTEDHPAVQSYIKMAMEKYGEEPYLGGLDTLKIAYVDGPVRIDEYDGSETVVTGYDDFF